VHRKVDRWCNGAFWYQVSFEYDMPTQVSSSVLQFADDLKMFRVIQNAQDFQLIQNDINKLVDRAKKW